MRTATRWFGLVTMIFVLVGVSAATSTPPLASAKGTTVKSSTLKAEGSSAGPKTTSTSKGATMKPTKPTTPKGNSAAAKTKSGATTRTSTKSGTTTTSQTTTSNTTSGSTTTSSGGRGSTVTTDTWTPDNAVAQKLSTKSNILKKVQSALGAGADLNGATAGFKNFGQFVAAINVSNNLGIDFADLKAAMTGINLDGHTTATAGTTSVTTMSLGQAIQKLKPGVDAETVARNALTQADKEINSSTTTTSSTSPTTTSTSTSSTPTTGTKAKPKARSQQRTGLN